MSAEIVPEDLLHHLAQRQPALDADVLQLPDEVRLPEARPRLPRRRQPSSEIQTHDLRLVIGDVVRELRVHVDGVVDEREADEQVVADEDVVQRLRVAFEHV